MWDLMAFIFDSHQK